MVAFIFIGIIFSLALVAYFAVDSTPTSENSNEQNREWSISQFNALQKLIVDGKWEYSRSKLKAEFDSYKFRSWFQIHPILTIALVLLCLPMGFIPVIIWGVVLKVQKSESDNYELHIQKLKNGTIIFSTNQIKTLLAGKADEISKLHELLKSGALTQEEFDNQKKIILENKKVA